MLVDINVGIRIEEGSAFRRAAILAALFQRGGRDVRPPLLERSAGILPAFFLNAGWKPALPSFFHLILSKSPSGQLLSK